MDLSALFLAAIRQLWLEHFKSVRSSSFLRSWTQKEGGKSWRGEQAEEVNLKHWKTNKENKEKINVGYSPEPLCFYVRRQCSTEKTFRSWPHSSWMNDVGRTKFLPLFKKILTLLLNDLYQIGTALESWNNMPIDSHNEDSLYGS